MQPTVNIEEIKKYNASLRQYRDKANQLKAEIEFNKQELDRKCAALSSELGIQVTPDNVAQILQERIEKINNTMSIGKEILQRITSEEQAAAQPSLVSPETQGQQATQVFQNTQVPGFNTGSNYSTPNIQASQMPQAPSFPDISDGLPPIFANR